MCNREIVNLILNIFIQTFRRMIKRLLFLIIFFTFSTSIVHAQIPRTGSLVGSYQFSGNAIDSSGSSNNGEVFGSPSLTSDRFNNTNSAYSFDGNDYF